MTERTPEPHPDRWIGGSATGLTRRLWMLALAIVIGFGVMTWYVAVHLLSGLRGPGVDIDIVRELGRRWLDTGSMYLPYQLAAPYSVGVTQDLANTPALYPPAAGPFFALASLVPPLLLAVGWWSVPILVVSVAIARWRPARWSWPLLAACLAYPETPMAIFDAGTSMLACGAIAAGLLWGWPAALILLKPTLGPFALVGVRSRGWWVASAGIVALTVLGPLGDYVQVAGNAAASGGGPLYSLGTYPLVGLPLVAWVARTRRGAPARDSLVLPEGGARAPRSAKVAFREEFHD